MLPEQTFPTKAAALAATKAVPGDYALLDKEEGVDLMSGDWTYYKYSVSPRPIIPLNDWTYRTGIYTHPSEAAAIAFVLADGQGYYCQQQLNPTTDWFTIGSLYAVPRDQAKGFDHVRFLWDEEDGCTHVSTHGYTLTRHRDAGYPPDFAVNGSTADCRNFTTARIYKRPLVCGPSTPHPCNTATGAKSLAETDYQGPVLSFTRYYQSLEPQALALMGVGWTHSFSARLVISSASPAGLIRASGLQEPLASRLTTVNGSTVTYWESLTASGIRIERQGTDYVAYLNDGSRELYSSVGRLLKVISPVGLETNIAYDTQNRITNVSVAYGHQLTFGYDAEGRLATVTNPGGGTIAFGFDMAGNLSGVTRPDGTTRTYLYEDASFPNHVTGVLDEENSRYKTANYDSAGRAVLSELAGGVERVTLTYSTNATTLENANGSQRTYNFTTETVQHRRVTSVVEGGFTRTWQVPANTTDALRRPTQVTDERGVITKYTYDNHQRTGMTEAFGTPRARTTTYQYAETRRDLPTQIDEYGRRTIRTYDANGNMLTNAVTDLLSSPHVSRTWTYTYSSSGQMLTADGPRTDVTDVTTYTYYNCAVGAECGQLHTVTDALNHVTTYNTYNAHGLPLTITDANGVVTTLTYDLMLRVTSRTVGGEATSYQYWPTGLLKKVTLPNGSFLQYTYDAAHRLIAIEDGENNRIDYTLDAMSNRTAESAFDPSNALTRTRGQVFDGLNRLWKEIGAAGTVAVTTEYGYDGNGNATSVNAPLGRNTATQFDELNRPKQITDAGGGITQMGYDAHDNLVSVTDPRSIATSYTYNGFGDLVQLASPDTGATVSTYDSGGNLATRTDARGKEGVYAYDAVNRVTSIAYADLTTSFTYDGGTNGAGRLTGASDANHALGFTYDALGRVTGKSQVVGAISKSVSYGYSNGNLTSMTTPSGQTIGYGYTEGRITSVTLNGSTAILDDVLYEPFGPVRGWTWGNGTIEARVYDLDGNLTDLESGGPSSYTYDNAFRITHILDNVDSSRSWSYGYDTLDRLNSAGSTGQTIGYTYDANGNRLAQTGTASASYTVASGNNRVSAVSGALARSYTYDAAGNTAGDGTNTYTYNDSGRLASVTRGGVTTAYVYNTLGQRVRKSSSAASVLFVYDEAGHLIGEYDGSGALIQETVWLGDIPIATLRPDGAGVSAYFVHSDHLNAPRRISRPSDGVIVWRWDSDPFGVALPDQDPDGDASSFVFNLRFPGQYADAESDLNYNYFRDYDPAAGRYVQSDPIGLAGGINTYAYVGGNPISLIDPLGLACRRGERIFRDDVFKSLASRKEMGELTVPFIGQVDAQIGISPEPPGRVPTGGIRGPRPGIGPNLSWEIIYFVWKRYEVKEGYIYSKFFSRKYYCKADDPCQQPQEWVELRPDGVEQDAVLDVHQEWKYWGTRPSGYTTATP